MLFKPHFGPENPDPSILNNKKAYDVNLLRSNLDQQVNERQDLKQSQLKLKRIQDEKAKLMNNMTI